MSERPFLNEPGRYDYARVAQIEPIEAAIDKLKLPPVRSRLLRGLLNALELQLELGGDSPEVNRLLIEALRAGVRHQVGERKAQPVLRALEVFEQAETERWK